VNHSMLRNRSSKPYSAPDSFGFVCSWTKFSNPICSMSRKLGLQPIDMLFLALQNLYEQFARDIVADPLAKPGRAVEIRQRALLEAKIAIEDVLDVLAHEKLPRS